MKRVPLKRKRELSRRSPIGRTAAPRKKGKKHATEWARKYGSKERVAWVKAYGCLCAPYDERRGNCSGPIENAHTVTGGMGRKAGYETIVPLCRLHHREYDEHRGIFAKPEVRANLAGIFAETIEAQWQAHVGAALAVPRAGAQK